MSSKKVTSIGSNECVRKYNLRTRRPSSVQGQNVQHCGKKRGCGRKSKSIPQVVSHEAEEVENSDDVLAVSMAERECTFQSLVNEIIYLDDDGSELDQCQLRKEELATNRRDIRAFLTTNYSASPLESAPVYVDPKYQNRSAMPKENGNLWSAFDESNMPVLDYHSLMNGLKKEDFIEGDEPIFCIPHFTDVNIDFANDDPSDVIYGPKHCVFYGIERKHWLEFKSTEGLAAHSIINNYLKLIKERSERRSDLPRVNYFTSHQWIQATSENSNNLFRKTDLDVFAYEIIFIPIFIECHWCLGVINFKDKFIGLYDSLFDWTADIHIPNIMHFMCRMYWKKTGTLFNFMDWEKRTTGPKQQKNDCGIILCLQAELIAAGRRLFAYMADGRHYRNKISKEIVEGMLIDL